MAKRGFKIVVYTLLVIIIVGIAVLPKLLEKEKATADGRKSGSKDKTVSVEALVIRADTLIDRFRTIGNMVADEEVKLKPEVSGKITRIYFREGQRVGKGVLLVKLNDAELQAQLKKAIQKEDLLAKIEERQRLLMKNNNISREDYEKAASDLEIQKSEIDYIKAEIDKTEIKAPFGGILGLRKVSEGAYVTTQDEITSIQKTDMLKIDFSIPQKYYNKVKPGTKIAFYVQPENTKYEAVVYASEPYVEASSRSLNLRAKIRNPKNMLMPGIFVEVEIELSKSDKSVMIPTQALVPDAASEKAYIYRGGKAVSVDVKSGIRTENRVEIVEGLSVGDTVICSGIIQLKPGAAVKLVKVN